MYYLLLRTLDKLWPTLRTLGRTALAQERPCLFAERNEISSMSPPMAPGKAVTLRRGMEPWTHDLGWWWKGAPA